MGVFLGVGVGVGLCALFFFSHLFRVNDWETGYLLIAILLSPLHVPLSVNLLAELFLRGDLTGAD